MKRLFLALLFLASPVLADTVGVVSGTNVVMVPATADAQVMQCAPSWTPANSCWPSTPTSIGPAVALGSLPSTAFVWAIAGASTNATWVPVSSLTITAAGIPTTTITTGSAALTWTAPTLNVDGTPLTNLASYNLYRGTSATVLTLLTGIPALATSFVDSTLTLGTWFYAITAVNATGQESAQAGPVSVNMTQAPPAQPVAPAKPGALSGTVTKQVPAGK